MKQWKRRLPIQNLKMARKSLFSVFACTLVLLSLMFGNGNYNTASVAYAAEPSPTRSFPVEGTRWSLSGWLNIVWGDGRDGETQTTYTLTDDSGAITPLLLDETLSHSVGGVLWLNRKRVNVEGVAASFLTVAGAETGLNVTFISLAPSPETAILADDISAAVSGAQPWVTIMCKFSDVATEPRNLAYFTNMYSNVYPRLDHYWRELSYDTFNVSGSNAYGWFTLPQPESYYNPTDTTGGANLNLLANDCIASADASVNFASYVGINMMFNTDFDNGYAWGGSRTMTLDGVTKTWRITWEPPWAYNSISVIQHEMGHGFGLPHSSGAYGATYDNAWDVMSKDRYNCAAATDPTYGCIGQGTISYHKDILGSISTGQKYTVALGSSATITLEQLALPQTTDYKMAKIPIGGSNTHFYTVEARRQTGYDSKVAGNAIIIHEVDTTRSRPAWVIDTDLNGNTADAGAMWAVGETFTDATNNISVHVDSATATGFQVMISNASSSCAVAIPLTSGVPYNGTTVGALSNVSTYSCVGWNESGPERFHVITTTVAGNITATLSNFSTSLNVFILSSCDPSSCLAYGDASATYSNAPPGTYYIVVDGYNGASGSYTLTLTTPPADTTPPSVTINEAAGQPDPTSTSPINFTVVFSEPVTGFATGDVTISGTAGGTKTATVTGSGTTYNVSVSGMTTSGTVIATIAAGVAQDAAGNPNTASTSTDNTVIYNAPDTTPPAAPISLGASPSGWTNTNSFSIDWTNPSDPSGIAGAYYKLGSVPTSNTDGTYTTNKPFTVSAGAQGGQVLYVWLRDGVGNTSYNNRSSTTLYYDGTAPTNGSLSAVPGNAQVSLSWSGYSDSGGSGLRSANTYKVVRTTGGYPGSQCTSGTQVYLGSGGSTTDIGLTNGTLYYYRACAYDNAGNVSSGATALATPQAPDTTPPAGVSNLATGAMTTTSVVLSWTAPGDDGNTGTATSYDIRYSTSLITEANWATATQVTGEPAPLVAGSAQSFTVTGLNCGTTYYFALKTSDEVPNTSAISNSPSKATSACPVTPPTVVTNSASGIGQTTATLNGTVNPNGANTTAYFQWGTSTSYGNNTSSQSLGSGTSGVAVSETLNSLTCNMTYHYRAVGTNSGGTNYGLDMTFATSACQVAPAPPTLISPSGTIATTTPTYAWNAVSNATDYYLWVNDSSGNRIQQWYTAAAVGCGSGTGACSVTPATVLNLGAGQWWVQAKNSIGTSPWGAPMSFTIQIPLTAATPVSPAQGSTITTATPPYAWTAVPAATYYYLSVNDPTGNRILQWYTASGAGCGSGTGNCTVTPSTTLSSGACNWKVQTWNSSSGYGPWSTQVNFTVNVPEPKATLVSPNGTITTATPPYVWNAVSGSTWYRLSVDDVTGNRIFQWYTASDAACGSGTGNCTVTPSTVLAAGAAKWKVQTWVNGAAGPWSNEMAFTVNVPQPLPPPTGPPGAATLISPSGSATTNTPTYQWNAVSNSTWYYLWVNDPTGNRIATWYTAAQVGCSAGTGTCSVTPTTALASGACRWWIQTYNSYGAGPWSAPMNFTVP